MPVRTSILSTTVICAILILVFLPLGCSYAELRVGTLRVIDSLPLSLALYRPIFHENKLLVQTIYFEDSAALCEAVAKGEVEAAIIDLPGAVLINTHQEQGKIVRAALRPPQGAPMLKQSVVVFNQKMVNSKPAVVRRFLRAYEQSVRELNVRPALYRSLLAGHLAVSPELTTSMPIPLFPFPGEVPTESEVEAANNWLVQEGMASKPVPYSRAVNPGFLWDPYLFRPALCCGW